MFKAIKLPFGKLSSELHLACEVKRWKELEKQLRAFAPNEACTFVLTRPSRGIRRTTVLLKEGIWPIAGDVRTTPCSLELSANYISRALDVMIDAGSGVGLALIHTHPPKPEGVAVAEFSMRDDWYDMRLIPTLLSARDNALFASVVIGANEKEVDARIWWSQNKKVKVQSAEILRLIGPEIHFIELKSSRWTDHPDPTLMDRSTRIWGKEGLRILQNIRVGVIGLGGTGSITFLSLATMGVGKLHAWEKDSVGKENLHRLLCVTKNDIGRTKGKVFTRLAYQTATADPFELELRGGLGERRDIE